MPKIIKNGKEYCSTSSLGKAEEIIFDNSNSSLTSTSVNSAINELKSITDDLGVDLDSLEEAVNNRTAIADLTAEADKGVNSKRLVICNSNTLNTPYKDGLTTFGVGLGIIFASSTSYASILYISSGTRKFFMNSKNNGTWSGWRDFENEITTLNSRVYTSKSNVDLNSIVTPGVYGVANSDTSVDLNFPVGTNGILVVMQYGGTEGARGRQIFFRVGTINSTDHQWHSRQFVTSNGTLTFGDWEQIISNKILTNVLADYAKTSDLSSYAKTSVLANYLPLEGGTITGSSLYIGNGNGRIYGSSSCAQLEHLGTAKNDEDRTVLRIYDSYDMTSAARLSRYDNSSSATTYYMYHTGSITAGTSDLTAKSSELTTNCIYLCYS